MNAFDLHILRFFDTFSGSYPSVDFWISVLADSDLFKGYVVMAFVWGIWFLPTSSAADLARQREYLTATLIGCLVALIVARGLAMVLPFRPRPFGTPEFEHNFALGRAQRGLDKWTSFPSDHATLFAALAAGLWLASRRTGWLLCTYVMAVVLLPRLYLGMHYPTDILGGIVIGVAIAWLVNSERLRPMIAGPLTGWRTSSPASFYACAFLLTSQIAVLFTPVRHLAGLAASFVSGQMDTALAGRP